MSRAVEARLLLASARLPGDPGAAAPIADSLAAGVDWSVVIARAREEGTAALLDAHLAALPDAGERVPSSVRASLSALHHATWARNTVLTERWREATAVLARVGVCTIALKGVVMIHRVYPEIGLRPMADIDVLIRAGDRREAHRALLEAGYRLARSGDASDDGPHGYAHFVRDGAVIDLHSDLADYPRVAGVLAVDHAGLWRRAQPFAVDGVEGLMLAPEDLLLHLVLHLTLGSEFGRLVWFTDIAAMLERFGPSLRWSRIMDEATRWRIRSLLAYTLTIAHQSLGAPLPPSVLERLRLPRVRGRLALGILGRGVPPSLAAPLQAPRAYVGETLLLDSIGDVARVVRTTFFPPPAWLRSHYAVAGPRTLRWRLGHPFRVCYLAARWLGGARVSD